MSESLESISERIREIREACELTQEASAQKLGIPLDMYVQYEKDGKDIPISVLYEMAKLFNVELTDILTGKSPKLHNYSYVKSGDGVEVERYKGYKFQSLAFNFIHKKVEPLLVTVEPEDSRNISLVTHPGQEFNYVIEGRIKIILGGNEIEMSKGDSIYFDPAIPHGQLALDNKSAKFITVILHEN
jgi:transcriptional regulator with XRE-family HTH domain